ERAKCSFHDGTEKPWTQSLPAGLYQLDTTLPVGGIAEWQRAQLAAFLDKLISREAGALLKDPPRIRKFLEETMPHEQIPDDALPSHIPNDANLIAEVAPSPGATCSTRSSASRPAARGPPSRRPPSTSRRADS